MGDHGDASADRSEQNTAWVRAGAFSTNLQTMVVLLMGDWNAISMRRGLERAGALGIHNLQMCRLGNTAVNPLSVRGEAGRTPAAAVPTTSPRAIAFASVGALSMEHCMLIHI